MVFENKLNYKTKKFNLNIVYRSSFVDVKDIVVDKEKFADLCRKGCSIYNKKWSCPPCSPSFLNIKNDFKKMFVFISYINTNQIKIKKPFLVLSNIYNILAPKMYKAGIILEKELSGILLKSGSCRVCKKCSFPNPCISPDKKRYALESVGVDVNNLSALLNHKLLWYNGKKLPRYTSIVCGVLTNKSITNKQAYNIFKSK